jgi:hypothetical protein
LKGFCGGTDDIDHQVGVEQHGHVTAGDFMRSGAHAFDDEALQLCAGAQCVVKSRIGWDWRGQFVYSKAVPQIAEYTRALAKIAQGKKTPHWR